LTETDHKKLAVFVRKHPKINFRTYAHYFVKSVDLDFLRHYPFLRKFTADVHTLKDISGLRFAPHLRELGIHGYRLDDLSGLEFVPQKLERFSFGQTKTKKHSLAFLQRFRRLQSLFIEGHTKDIDAIGALSELQDLTLRSITLPDLRCLRPLKQLLSLDIKLGGTKDLGLLPQIGRLRYLELWLIKGLCDLAPVANISTLQFLFLQALRNVKRIPSLAKLEKLRRLHLQQMKGLVDLRPIAAAPALEDLIVYEMRHLEADAFQPFIGHRSLKHATISLGGARKRNAVKQLLGLPEVNGTFKYDR
jgi:internalin A